MASESFPPPNLGEEATDTEHDREEEAEEAEGEGQERQEGPEGPQKAPQGSWAGSHIVQSDIDRLHRSRRIPDGVETRVVLSAVHISRRAM